ncbi:hypothetical protein [Burkholderia stagnalis]|uniref:hypothetical protein n=1 Tax=Burkholderia stagnalis TaxID=1503054 RepID=UPI0012D901E4|nr:hypothetical protein [Burkholderia stagnalis]
MTMVTNHYRDCEPVIDPFKVVDDFGRMLTLVPDMDYFGEWSSKLPMAALAFVRSGEVH